MKSRHVIGALVALTAVTQTGCAALGLATLGMSVPRGVETAALPDGPMSGAATLPGNGTVSFTVNLLNPPTFNTQYVLEDISRLVIGLVDLNHADGSYLGYEGPNKMTADPVYHAAIAGTVAGGSHTQGLLNYPAGASSNTERINRNRFLYYPVTTGITGTTNRNVKFTNIKPGTSRYIAFAAAFTGNVNSPSLSTAAGFTQTAAITTTGNLAGDSVTTAPSITLNLNYGLGKIENSTPLVTIIEHKPSAE